MSEDSPQQIWAPAAWLPDGWRHGVLLDVDRRGCWGAIRTDQARVPDALCLDGPLVPGVVNSHSHAFQRGFAGRTERREGAHDDFWSWREQMYGLALRVSPAQLEAIATQLYVELLEGGYTHVCEFHYLHHDRDGSPFADPHAMMRALASAAGSAGIGLTILPVLYERAGFTESHLSERQRRFRSSVSEVLAMRDAARRWGEPLISAGTAIHSLRAASASSVQALARMIGDDPGPVHIHIAEQRAEVRDCLASTGLSPVAWLDRNVTLDARWHLVHATHVEASEQDAIARARAGVVVCPTTEADLGDGRFDLDGFSNRGIGVSIGSDSHVCRSWMQEIRLLEYSQRLSLERRNVAARPDRDRPSSAEAVLEVAVPAGARAAGLGERWGLAEGARADAVELECNAAGLLGIPANAALDAAVFASDSPPVKAVWVAGRLRVKRGSHLQRDRAASGFRAALGELAA
ncbi:MAG: formimidoylglutamate deiminase [Betaproteobacteria bacterium]